MSLIRLAGLLVMAIASLGIAAAPFVLTGPMRAQDAGALDAAYNLERWGGWWTLALLIAGLLLVTRQWVRGGWLSRSFAVVFLVGIFGGVYLARVNVLESMMFARVDGGRYVPASSAGHVGDGDLVLGMTFEGRTLAYPVSIIGYHHIVNERLKVEPFVVTY